MLILTGVVRGELRRIELPAGRWAIGRALESDIRLEDPSVSRRHAELEVREGLIELCDLGSSNHTFVNDLRIERTQLRPGDRVRLGQVELELRLEPDQTEPTDRWGSGAAGAQAGGVARRQDDGPAGPEDLRGQLDWVDPERLSARDRLSLLEARSLSGGPTSSDHALLRAVTEAGQVLVSARPLAETFETVLDLVERVTPARRIFLLLTEAPGEVPAVRAARPAGIGEDQLLLSRTILATVLHDRQALLLNDVPSDPRFGGQESVILQNVRSAMVAPLFDNQQVIGLLYTDSDDPLTRYDRDQLRAFALVANLVGIKITNARLLEADRERERIAQELAAAAEVQRTLLPATLPAVPGYEFAARQRPCHEVGGDLYDVARLPDGRILLVIGDVAGKGLAAAMLMSNVLAGLRVLCQEELPLLRLAQRLHAEVHQSSDAVRFVTLFAGVLDPLAHRLEYVNAGHNAPLLFSGGAPPRTLAATGLPLGMLAGASYEVAEIEVPAGALLCLYSDGISEAEAGEEQFGEERLWASLRGRRDAGLPALADGLLADVARFLGETAPSDDMTLLLLRRSS